VSKLSQPNATLAEVRPFAGMSQVNPDAAGVDIGAHEIVVCEAGERDPHKLAALRNYRCKKDEEEIAQALTGTWLEEHLFIL